MNRDIINRIKSIRQTVKISSAQKLLAASKISRAKKLLEESLPYHNSVSRAFAEVLAQSPEHNSRYIETDKSHINRRGLLVLSANRGLAGGYNSDIVRFTERLPESGQGYDYMIVLGKARNILLHKNMPVDADYYQPLDPPTLKTAGELSKKITTMLDNGQIDSFDVIHTVFKSSVKLEVTRQRLFPINPDMVLKQFGEGSGKSDFAFEPSAEEVIASIARKYLKGFLYGCLVHSWISELTSRVMAMDSAIRNGNDMLEWLSLTYNRQRQAAITQEITEIVASVEAMAQSS